MSQNGYPQQGASPVQQDAHHSSKRRQYPSQQYNFNATPAPAYPDAMGYVGGSAASYAGASQPGGPTSYSSDMPAQASVFTPAMAGGPSASPVGQYSQNPSFSGADQLSSQFSSMNVSGQGPAAANNGGVNMGPAAAASGYYGGAQAPSTSSYGAGYNSGYPAQSSKVPLNQIYNLDLFAFLPPPISDLDLPPPPIILPTDATCTQTPNAIPSHKFIRSTLNVVPTTNSLLKKSKLPFALIISPFSALQEANDNVPVIEGEFCRCKRCRCYFNPYVTLLNQGHRWKCNICGMPNDLPQRFHENTGVWSRTDLNHSVVDFVAPSSYMVRPPQPPVYVFLIDVSIQSISNGLLATASRVIKENLDRLPNTDDRCQVAFVAVDQAMHFFDIGGAEEGDVPSMFVVTDLEKPFLPLPSGLLVNLTRHRNQIDTLLDKLPEMFDKNINAHSGLCSALKACHDMISSIGGKVVVLTASIPDVGLGSLEAREDRKVFGTAKESALLRPASKFYKVFAIDCNKAQISIDLFLFSNRYQDVASLSNLPRFTGGQTYFYPGWNASRAEDAIKLAHELGEHMAMEVGLEAVMRVRCSSTLKTSAFYGNMFNRSTDLCAFPAFPRDQTYVIEIGVEDTTAAPTVGFQVAVLHSTSSGQRRIRCITLHLPTSSAIQDIYASADQLAITTYLSHKACEKALSSGLEDASQFVYSKIVDLLMTYKKELMTTNVGSSSPLQFCANLRMLPLLANALLKSVGIRKSNQIASDLRSASICLLSTLPVKYLINYLHPDLFSLHDMPDEAGVPDETSGEIVLPPKLNLSGEMLVSHGLYLIHDGQTMFLWIGRDAVPQLILDAFGYGSKEEVPCGKGEVPETESPLNVRIRLIIAKLREKKDNITWPSLFIVREDGEPSLKLWVSTFLIEDKTDRSQSYHQFLSGLRDKISN